MGHSTDPMYDTKPYLNCANVFTAKRFAQDGFTPLRKEQVDARRSVQLKWRRVCQFCAVFRRYRIYAMAGKRRKSVPPVGATGEATRCALSALGQHISATSRLGALDARSEAKSN